MSGDWPAAGCRPNAIPVRGLCRGQEGEWIQSVSRWVVLLLTHRKTHTQESEARIIMIAHRVPPRSDIFDILISCQLPITPNRSIDQQTLGILALISPTIPISNQPHSRRAARRAARGCWTTPLLPPLITAATTTSHIPHTTSPSWRPPRPAKAAATTTTTAPCGSSSNSSSPGGEGRPFSRYRGCGCCAMRPPPWGCTRWAIGTGRARRPQCRHRGCQVRVDV